MTHNTGRMLNLNIRHVSLDLLIIIVIFVAAYFLTPARFNDEFALSYVVMLPSFCIVFFLFMNYYRMYNKATLLFTDIVIKNTASSFIFSSIVLFMYLFLAYNTTFSRIFLVVFIFAAFIAIITEKLILLQIRKILTPRNNTIYIGDVSGNTHEYEEFLKHAQLSSFSIFVLGYIDIYETNTEGGARLGNIIDFETILRNHPCFQVVFSQSAVDKIDLDPFLNIANEMGVVSRVLLDISHINNYNWDVSSFGLYPMLTYYNKSIDPFLLAIKRLIDIAGSLLGIILSSPIMLITAIAIKIDSAGPVLFKQKRVGLNGKKFNILKFRSMVNDAEMKKKELEAQNEMGDARLFKMKDDPRITKVGKLIRKTSIDELPQFFNVLKGDMCLVGTRPPTVSEVAQYDRRHLRRISIKPGITGIWQTNGRNSIRDFEQIVQMDLYYIDNWSLYLDFKLMLKTIVVLLNKDGAY